MFTLYKLLKSVNCFGYILGLLKNDDLNFVYLCIVQDLPYDFQLETRVCEPTYLLLTIFRLTHTRVNLCPTDSLTPYSLSTNLNSG